MGLAFGMSLVLILVSGTSLITADMAAGFLAVLHRRMSTSAYCRVLGVGFAGNTIGALIFWPSVVPPAARTWAASPSAQQPLAP